MLTRSLVKAAVPVSRRLLAINAPSASAIGVRFAHEPTPSGYKFPTMDELPVPCGSWQEHYDNNQRKYNIHLLLGTGVFVITMTFAIYSGVFDLYILAPLKPAPRKAP